MFKLILKNFFLLAFVLAVSNNASAETSITTLTLTETKGHALDNVPITFAQPFVSGKLPQNTSIQIVDSTNTPLSTQTDKKAFYPDGSLKHAVISFILPELAANQTKTLTLTTIEETSNNNDNTSEIIKNILADSLDFTVTIDSNGNKYYASFKKFLQNQEPKLWLKGSLCNEFHVAGALKNEQNQEHPLLWVIFYFRTYQNSDIVRLSVTVENNWTYVSRPRNLQYDVTIKANEEILFAKTQLTHFNHARFHKAFFIDTASDALQLNVTDTISSCNVSHDIRYLIRTQSVPSYDSALIGNMPQTEIEKLLNLWNQNNEPMQFGLVSWYLNSASKGPLPQWTSAYLLTMNPVLKNITIGHGEISGSWPVHFRDKNTLFPVSINDYPYVSTIWNYKDAYNPNTGKYEYPSQCKEGDDCSFSGVVTFDSLAYVPYLLTGDYYFLEELQFRSNYYLILQNPGYREYSRGLVTGIPALSDQAWALRSLGQTAYITPDNHPLKNYFVRIVNENIRYFTAQYLSAQSGNSLGWVKPLQWNSSEAVINTDQDDYFTWSIGQLYAFGFKEAYDLMKWKSRLVVSRMTDNTYCRNFAALPNIYVGSDQTKPELYFTQMSQAWYPTIAKQYGNVVADSIKNLACNSSEMRNIINISDGEMPLDGKSADGNAARMQIALATAVDAGVDKSLQAWKLFYDRATKPNYSQEARPNFAIVPFLSNYENAGVFHTSLTPEQIMLEGKDGFNVGFALKSCPTQNVTISFESDAQINIVPNALTFDSENFNVVKYIKISAIDDQLPETTHKSNVVIKIASDDIGYRNLTLPDFSFDVYDNDSTKAITLSNSSMDFGVLQLRSQNEKSLTVTNTYGTPIEISSVQIVSDSFKMINSCEGLLLPQKSCNITVSYTSSTADSIREHTGTIIIKSNTEPSAYTININAKVVKRVIKVGPNRDLKWVRQAAEMALDMDIIEIDTGVYYGDVASWLANDLTIRGVGNGFAHLNANGRDEEGKAIWVIKGNNTVVENIEFSHCEVPDRNGAGIRLEGNNLTLRNCYFHHNQTGILTSVNLTDCEVLIDGCEFAYQGFGDGLSHNMYINTIKKFTLINSYSHHAFIGHNVKTRAYENHILYNRITDESKGRSSYLVDFSQGGKNIVVGNIFHQGKYTENPSMISDAAEKPLHPKQELYIVNNTFVNDRDGDTKALQVLNNIDKVVLANNVFVGCAQIISDADKTRIASLDSITNLETTMENAGFRNPSHYDYHLLNATSPLRDAGTAIQNIGDLILVANRQYTHPRMSALRPVDSVIDIGAYEYSPEIISVKQSENATVVVCGKSSDNYEIILNDKPSSTVVIKLFSNIKGIVITPDSLEFSPNEQGVSKNIVISSRDEISENLAIISHGVFSEDLKFNLYSLPDISVIINPNPSSVGLLISENIIDFGVFKNIDPKVRYSVAISNNHPYSIDILGIALNAYENNAYTMSHGCPSFVFPNAYCFVNVEYNPATVGKNKAEISIETAVTGTPAKKTTQKIEVNGSSVLEQDVIKVGHSRRYLTPRDAAAIVRDGDLVEIDAGVYENNVALWSANDLTIRGVGGKAHMKIIDGKVSYEGKAIWVITGNRVTVENIEFSGCRVSDFNGTGIRAEGIGLHVIGCYFHHNEGGILTKANMPESDLIIERCEFSYNGYGDGYSHNMYINTIRNFVLKDSYSHHAKIGHTVKTRAKNNFILYNRLMDETDGYSSYLIDFSQGGNNLVMGNLFHQGKNSENMSMVAQAGERANNNDIQRLIVINNTFVNERQGQAQCIHIFDDVDQVVIKNNLVVGTSVLLPEEDFQKAKSFKMENNVFTSAPGFVDAANYDYRLTSESPAIDQGGFFEIMPYFQYVHPMRHEKRFRFNFPDAGAYEFQAEIRLIPSTKSMFISEGQTDSCHEIALTKKPKSQVTINFAISQLVDHKILANPTSLVFLPENFNTPQKVCITVENNNMAQNIAIGELQYEIITDDPEYANVFRPNQKLFVADNDPALILSSKTLDFGELEVSNQSQTKKVTVTNQGHGVFSIDKILAEPTFITISHNCNNQLKVGEFCYIEIFLTPNKTGEINGQVAIYGNSQNSPDIITIKGTGIENFSEKPIVQVEIEDLSDKYQTDVPVTFGQIFKQGDVTRNQTIIARLENNELIPIQSDRKATHSDRSLRHAVLSLVLPEMYAKEHKTITLISTGIKNVGAPTNTNISSLLSTNFDALVMIVLNNRQYKVSARELLKNASEQNVIKWLSGTICNEWQVSSPLVDTEGKQHPHLSAGFYLRAYTNKNQEISNIKVSVILENTRTFVPSPRNYTYDVLISVNGKQYEKKQFTHFHHARWKKDFWYENVNEPDIKPDVRYLIASKAIPNYDPNAINTIPESALEEMAKEWEETRIYPVGTKKYELKVNEPMSPGFANPYYFSRGGAGWRDLGQLPQWTLRYLLSLDPRAKKVTMGTGQLAGSYSLHYRDEATGRPISIEDHPFSSIQDGDTSFDYHERVSKKPAACIAQTDCQTPYNIGLSGLPSLSYVPYLLSGDYYDLEELQFYAAYTMLQRNHDYRKYEKGLFIGAEIHDQAWSIRTIGRAAYITPDNHPLKKFFNAKVQDNLDYYNEQYTWGHANQFGYIPAMYRDPVVSPGGDDNFTQTIAHLYELGFENALPLLRWKSKFAVERMTNPDYCRIFAAPWQIRIGLFANVPESYFDSYKDIYFETLVHELGLDKAVEIFGLECGSLEMAKALNYQQNQMFGYHDPHSYLTYLQVALAAAVDAKVQNADLAWERYMSRPDKADYYSSAYHNNNIVPRNADIINTENTDIIVDNTDIGFSTEGVWFESGMPGSYSENSLYTTKSWIAGYQGKAYWQTDLVPGWYDIYAWWISNSSRNDKTPYVIHTETKETVYVNQHENGGKWNYLGRFYFNNGNALVEVIAEVDNTTTSADAIRFSKPLITIQPGHNNFKLISESTKAEVYTIMLEKTPQQQVLINITSEDFIEISPTKLVFVSGQGKIPQTVTLSLKKGVAFSDTKTVQVRHEVITDDSIYKNQGLSNINLNIYTPTKSESDEIVASSGFLSFDKQAIGVASGYQKIKIINSGKNDIDLTEIKVTGQSFELSHQCPEILVSGQSCELSVRFMPTQGYNYSEYIVVLGSNGFEYKIPISGIVDAPIERPVLKVGTGKTYKTPSQAIAAADHGSIIEIDAGEYPGDVAVIDHDDLIIRGVNGYAHLIANGLASEEKAIWVIKGMNTTVENIEFSGCRVKDKNGAGIRQEGNNLTLKNCYFHDNEMGILTISYNPACDVTIDGCIFERNGYGDGLSHNIYINHIRKFILTNSYSHLAKIGHNVKTRADENHILYNRIMDEETGNSSYQINLPNGGRNYIIGNIIHQGKNAENPCIISQGEEGAINPKQELYVVHNTIINDLAKDSSVFVRAVDKTTVVILANNLLLGKGLILDGTTGDLFGNIHLTDQDAKLVNRNAYDYRLTQESPAINKGDGIIWANYSLFPTHEYEHPLKLNARTLTGGIPDVGAYEYVSTSPSDCHEGFSTNKITLFDMIRLLQTISDIKPVSSKICWDINGDGKIGLVEVIMSLQKMTEL